MIIKIEEKNFRTIVNLIFTVSEWHHVTAMVTLNCASNKILKLGFVQVYNIENE